MLSDVLEQFVGRLPHELLEVVADVVALAADEADGALEHCLEDEGQRQAECSRDDREHRGDRKHHRERERKRGSAWQTHWLR